MLGTGRVWDDLDCKPEMVDSSRANRDFLVRAVAFARDGGARQFLDIGTGLPTSPNTHETAQDGHPDVRVVYVDNDRWCSCRPRP